MSGRGGAGKSTYVTSKLAAVTRGTLPGIYHGAPEHVAIIGALEDGESVAKLRIQANGGDPHLVHVPEFFDDEGTAEGFSLKYLAELREFLVDHRIRVAMIDQLNLLVRDQNKASDIGRVLPPLNEVARSVRCSIIGINHLRKGGGVSGDLMAGSAMLRNNARALILMAADGDERVATLDKFNLSSSEGQSWKFRLQSTTVPTDDGGSADIARVEELGDSDSSVEQVVNRQYAEALADDTEPSDAGEWLLGFQADRDGEAPAKEIFKAAKADGVSERTLQRIRAKRGVASVRQGFGNGAIWVHPMMNGANGANGANDADKGFNPTPIGATGANGGANGGNDLTRPNTRETDITAPFAPLMPYLAQEPDRQPQAAPDPRCPDCGDPLAGPSLMQRCESKHMQGGLF